VLEVLQSIRPGQLIQISAQPAHRPDAG
jgi:hypothetical protein